MLNLTNEKLDLVSNYQLTFHGLQILYYESSSILTQTLLLNNLTINQPLLWLSVALNCCLPGYWVILVIVLNIIIALMPLCKFIHGQFFFSCFCTNFLFLLFLCSFLFSKHHFKYGWIENPKVKRGWLILEKDCNILA